MFSSLTASNVQIPPNMFPFPFWIHAVFSCVSLVFFAYLFARDRKLQHLLYAIAIPFSLTIWLSDDKKYFYLVGLIEFVFLCAISTASLIEKRKARKLAASLQNTASLPTFDKKRNVQEAIDKHLDECERRISDISSELLDEYDVEEDENA